MIQTVFRPAVKALLALTGRGGVINLPLKLNACIYIVKILTCKVHTFLVTIIISYQIHYITKSIRSPIQSESGVPITSMTTGVLNKAP